MCVLPNVVVTLKDMFYDNLSMEMLKAKKKCVLLGNFHGHIDKDEDGYKSVHGRFSYDYRNADGKELLQFAD